MKKFIIFIMLIFITGCAGMPGNINISKSQYDDATEIYMTPAWTSSGGIKLGLFWSSRLENDEIILTAAVDGIKSFAPGESLRFKIDGEKISFKSIDNTPSLETAPGGAISVMRYSIDRPFIEKLIEAEKVIVRVELINTYNEAEFSDNKPFLPKPGFSAFIEKLPPISK